MTVRKADSQWESRVFTVGTHDAILADTHSNFEIDIGNSDSTMNNGIFGVSIDNAGFTHVFPNIRPTANSVVDQVSLSLEGTLGGVVQFTSAFIIPTGWYTEQELVDYLNTEVPTTWFDYPFSEVVFGINTSRSEDHRIVITLNDLGGANVDNVNVVVGSVTSHGGNYLGWPHNAGSFSLDFHKYFDVSGVDAPFPPSLEGDQVVFIHSSILVDKEVSIDGEGKIGDMLVSIPITVPRNGFQTYAANQYRSPTIYYDDPVSVTKLRFDLRDVEGRPLDVGAGSMWLNIRVWW